MSRLPIAARRELWETIQSKPSDPKIISAVIDKLEMCGAIADCQQQAEDLVESAWQGLDAIVPDSDIKLKLRAFSWYVLARHY